ncbi:MAG: ATPase, T2SS/T4P/T4SS family [Planctomycetota bacterium]
MPELLKRKPLGQLLLERGIVSSADLDAALAIQKHSGNQRLLGEVIVDEGFATEGDVLSIIAEDYGVPFAHVNPRLADPKVIPALDRETIERHTVLPLFLVDDVLTVAVTEPANVFLVEELERISGHRVQVVAATAHDIESTLQAYMPDGEAFVIDEIIDDIDEQDFTLVEAKKDDIADLEAAAGDSPVIKLVNFCVYTAVKEGASDIHIEPQEKGLRIRFRIDGHLHERLSPPQRMQAAVVSRIKIMAGLDIAERRLPQDGGIHVQMDKRPIDLRISTMPGRHGEKVVIRVIDNEKAQHNLEKLGFGYEMLKQWRELIAQPNGIILVTGPTGSGKSTTLYAALAEINAEQINISTVEDPVEYHLPGINQFQVNEKAGFTFPSALRALLRQDPDVVMVGEVRDDETARLATQAALTGHLVFSTLHTNDAVSAATRLFNLGIEPYLVGATLGGVLAQRLVRRLCDDCKKPAKMSKLVATQMEELTGSVPDEIFKPGGCDSCRETGFAGRLGIYELLRSNDVILEAITRGTSLGDLRKVCREAGMTTLRKDGAAKVASGVTTLDEIMRVTT